MSQWSGLGVELACYRFSSYETRMSRDRDAVASQLVFQPLYLAAPGDHSPPASEQSRLRTSHLTPFLHQSKQTPTQPPSQFTPYLPPFPLSPLPFPLSFPPLLPLAGHPNANPPMPPLLPPGPLPLMPFPPTPRAIALVTATGAADGGVGEADGAPGCCWVFESILGVGGGILGMGGRVGCWDGGEEGCGGSGGI